ncbi:MAG: response regulator [Bacteroidota bacterium]
MDNTIVDILLIEDNMQDAELTARALKKLNLTHHILHLKDSIEALNFIFSQKPISSPEPHTHIKLILLDLKMPKVSGIEVLKRIKSDDRTKIIPTVILTSSKQEHDISEALSAGANSYVVKPVSFAQFTETVSQVGFYWLMHNQSSR